MSDIAIALMLDVLVLCVCSVALLMYGRLSAFHPGSVYVFFHFYTVTLRLAALTSGAAALFMPEPISIDEIIRAALLFDVGLASATGVWLYLARRERRGIRRISHFPPWQVLLLSPRLVRIVALPTLIIGLIGLRFLRFSDPFSLEQNHASLGGWDSSSWVLQIVTWAQQGSLMLHYVNGFQPFHVCLTVVLFALTMLSTARYVLLIWGIFACYIVLSKKKLRWPPRQYAVGLLFIAVLWFPLKVVTQSIWAGLDARTIASNVVDYFRDAMSGGDKADTTFLDQAASTMTLVDANGELFYGRTLLPLLVSPVPRVWWPDKPHMNEYQHVISTPGRPMSTYGSIATLVGEGYANFGYVGGVLFPVLAAYLYGRAYFAAMERPHNSVFRFLYLVVASMLLQVYRDGFVAAVLFPLTAAMPMMALVVAHWAILPVRRCSAVRVKSIDLPLALQNGPQFRRVAWGDRTVMRRCHHVPAASDHKRDEFPGVPKR
jgi:hypothetical protein